MVINAKLFILSGLIFLLQIANPVVAEGLQTEDEAEQLYQKMLNSQKARDLDSVYINAKVLMDFAKENSLTYFEGRSNASLGSYYYLKGNIDSALQYYIKAVQLFTENGDTILYGQTNVRIAIIHYAKGNMDTAIYYYNKGLETITIKSDPLWYGIIKDHLGLLYMKQDDYFNALENMQEAVAAYTKSGNKLGMGSEYNNMGIVYKETNNENKAEEAYLNAIKFLSEIEETNQLGMAYNNLASIYIAKGEDELGLEILEKAKHIYENTEYFVGLTAYYSVLSLYYREQKTPDYYKVIESSNKGMLIAEEYNNYRQYAHATNVLGEAYLKTNQINKAEVVLKLGLSVSEKYEYASITAQIRQLLSEVYDKKGQLKLALENLQKYVILKDSLIDEEKIKEFTSLDLKFKFRQEQIRDSLEIQDREKKINLLHEKELYSQKVSNLIFAFISLIIFIVAVFIFYNLRKRKKQAHILSIKNSQIEKSLLEKEILLKEVHHRVKNNFQTVSSLLELQSDEVQDKKAIESIREGQNRIKAMALIHQRLYQNDDISKVDFHEYIEQLSTQIASLYSLYNTKIIIKVNNVQVDIDTAIPLGLIINELVTNAFKYAFSKDRENILTISLDSEFKTHYILRIADNGGGLPKGFEISKAKSLGLRLIRLLSKQLHGNINYRYDGGSVFEVSFKDEDQRKEID